MVPEIAAAGLLLIGDPHLADTPPGQRLPGFREQVLAKLAVALDVAAAQGLVPVVLGDLFHWPRDNSNALLVALIELFAGPRPFVLVGNHDKHQARLTRDVSLSVLEAAGVVRVMAEPGPQFTLRTPEGEVLVGASPDNAPIPRRFPTAAGGPGLVVWLTHHGIRFPEFADRSLDIREIPGIDWVINGHIHRPQPTVRAGATTWANPGNITRLTFARRTLTRRPAAFAWRPGCAELARIELPHLPFGEVFPDQEFPSEEAETDSESGFLQGLERLSWRRTREGMGLREFLQANLNPGRPETRLVWELYEEVTGAHGQEQA